VPEISGAQYFAGAANIGAESIEKTFLFVFILNIGIGVALVH